MLSGRYREDLQAPPPAAELTVREATAPRRLILFGDLCVSYQLFEASYIGADEGPKIV